MSDLRSIEHIVIPAHPRQVKDGPPEIGFELLAGPDGRPFPAAFSSVRSLVDALGDAQPWIVLPVAVYGEVMRKAGYGPILLDPPVAPNAPRWSHQDVRRLVGAQAENQR